MMQASVFFAAVQALAVIGWLAAVRWPRLDVEWRVLAAVTLPALATIAWLSVRYVVPAWTASATPEQEGGVLVLVLVAMGSGMFSAALALPMAMFLEHRHTLRDV